MPSRQKRRTTSPTVIVVGYRDLELISPKLAVWQCRCRVRNQVSFARDVVPGFVHADTLQCSACKSRFRGRMVIAAVVLYDSRSPVLGDAA